MYFRPVVWNLAAKNVVTAYPLSFQSSEEAQGRVPQLRKLAAAKFPSKRHEVVILAEDDREPYVGPTLGP